MLKLIKELENKVKNGGSITYNEAGELAEISDELVPEMAAAAGRIRFHYHEQKSDLCSILSARSGSCGEDCRFCAQSAHYNTNIKTHPMLDIKEIVRAARRAEAAGAHRFCLVTSGGRLSKNDFQQVLAAVAEIKETTSLKRCASLGALNADEAAALSRAGLNRYHHNLETAKSFFNRVCTTHTYESRLKTISNVKKAGLEVCVGGILNLGESDAQRLQFAFETAAVEPDSVPLNFLVPRPGTPLAGRPPLAAVEAIKYIALFRFIIPKAIIRLAAGRCQTLGQEKRLGLSAGVNGLLIGDFLTTPGSKVEDDLRTLTEMGFKLTAT